MSHSRGISAGLAWLHTLAGQCQRSTKVANDMHHAMLDDMYTQNKVVINKCQSKLAYIKGSTKCSVRNKGIY